MQLKLWNNNVRYRGALQTFFFFFAALKLPFGKTTVMHLVARETLPEPNSQGTLCKLQQIFKLDIVDEN